MKMPVRFCRKKLQFSGLVFSPFNALRDINIWTKQWKLNRIRSREIVNTTHPVLSLDKSLSFIVGLFHQNSHVSNKATRFTLEVTRLTFLAGRCTTGIKGCKKLKNLLSIYRYIPREFRGHYTNFVQIFYECLFLFSSVSGGQWSPASGTWQLPLVYTHEMFRVRVITRDWDVLRWCNVSQGQPHVKRNSLFAIFFLLKSRLNGQNWTAWYGVGKATMAKTRESLAVFSWLFFHLISCLQRHRNFTNDLYYAIKCVRRIVFFFHFNHKIFSYYKRITVKFSYERGARVVWQKC